MSRAGRHALFALLALVAVPACEFGTASDGDGDTAASGDGDGDGDTTTTGGGNGNALVLQFEADPAVPGSVEGDFEAQIEVASMTVRDVRVIGDASTLGARNTSFDWASTPVQALRYAPVVPGLYSRVRGEVTKLELSGTLELDDGIEREFEIKGDGNMLGEFSTEIAARVGPNEEIIVRLTADLHELIDAVAWERVCSGGFCGVGKNDPDFAAVADELQEIFESDEDEDEDERRDAAPDSDGASDSESL